MHRKRKLSSFFLSFFRSSFKKIDHCSVVAETPKERVAKLIAAMQAKVQGEQQQKQSQQLHQERQRQLEFEQQHQQIQQSIQQQQQQSVLNKPTISLHLEGILLLLSSLLFFFFSDRRFEILNFSQNKKTNLCSIGFDDLGLPSSSSSSATTSNSSKANQNAELDFNRKSTHNQPTIGTKKTNGQKFKTLILFVFL